MNLIYKSAFTVITVISFISFVFTMIFVVTSLVIGKGLNRAVEICAPMSFNTVYKLAKIEDVVKKAAVAVISRLGL
jgi:hypothetical protein